MIPIILIFLIVVFSVVAVLLGKSKTAKENEKKFQALNKTINETHMRVIGYGEITPAKQLEELSNWLQNNCAGKIDRYKSSKGMLFSCDTYSQWGHCGVSKTHLFMNLEELEPEEERRALNACALKNEYMEILFMRASLKTRKRFANAQSRIKNAILYIEEKLPVYEQIKSANNNISIKTIALEDILCFKVEGIEQYVSDTQGGGVNLQGAVAGAVLAGGAAAIIGSQIGTEVRTQIVKKDDRKVIVSYKENGKMITTMLDSSDCEKTIKAFRKLIPQKEEHIVRIEAERQ